MTTLCPKSYQQAALDTLASVARAALTAACGKTRPVCVLDAVLQ